MIRLAVEYDLGTTHGDDAGHDADTLSLGFEAWPLLYMRFEISEVTAAVEPGARSRVPRTLQCVI